MPVNCIVFRAACGFFLPVYIKFMTERALQSQKLKAQVIKTRNRLDIILFVFVALHLLCCGDCHPNPGPVSPTNSMTDDTENGTSPFKMTDTGAVQSVNNPHRNPKRNRSSDIGNNKVSNEELHSDIRALIREQSQMRECMEERFMSVQDTLNTRLQGMEDMIDRAHDDIAMLNETVEVLSEENSRLKEEVQKQGEKIDRQEEKLDYLENQSRRQNLVFHNIPQTDRKETWEDCERMVMHVIKDSLKIDTAVSIERVHRVGKAIVVRFLSFKDRERVRRSAYKLKGTNFGISEDFSKTVRERRKELIGVMKQYHSKNERATLVYDKLYTPDGVLTFDTRSQKITKSNNQSARNFPARETNRFDVAQSNQQERNKQWHAASRDTNSPTMKSRTEDGANKVGNHNWDNEGEVEGKKPALSSVANESPCKSRPRTRLFSSQLQHHQDQQKQRPESGQQHRTGQTSYVGQDSSSTSVQQSRSRREAPPPGCHDELDTPPRQEDGWSPCFNAKSASPRGFGRGATPPDVGDRHEGLYTPPHGLRSGRGRGRALRGNSTRDNGSRGINNPGPPLTCSR